MGSITEIKVENGVVSARAYEASKLDAKGTDEIIYSTYHEDSTKLNTHDEGSPTYTMEKLYTLYETDYLTVDTNRTTIDSTGTIVPVSNYNTITFNVSNEGIIRTCGYTPNNCMDDCFVGVYINAFEWLD